jgi:FkbM family methyltransferase
VSKLEWYRTALSNLGFLSLARLQFEKRLSRPGLCALTSKILQFHVLARSGASDLMVFHQIFVEREYSPLDQLKNVGLVIDCGANVGYSSTYFLSTHPQSFVIAVEPDEGNFAILERNLHPYGKRTRAIRAAVWRNHEKLQFKGPRTSGGEWGYSVEQADQEFGLTSVTVPELIEMSGFRRVSILKVDIEGAELNLFQFNSEWIDLVDNLVIELHGPECSEVFFRAISRRGFKISTSGELIVCLTDPVRQ